MTTRYETPTTTFTIENNDTFSDLEFAVAQVQYWENEVRRIEKILEEEEESD